MPDSDTLQMSLNRSANRAALDAVVRHSELRGKDADRVARYAVEAARPKLNAAYVAGLLGTSKRETSSVAAGALALLALDVVVAGSVVRDGGRVARVAGGIALAGHVAFAWYAQARNRKLRTTVALKAKP